MPRSVCCIRYQILSYIWMELLWNLLSLFLFMVYYMTSCLLHISDKPACQKCIFFTSAILQSFTATCWCGRVMLGLQWAVGLESRLKINSRGPKVRRSVCSIIMVNVVSFGISLTIKCEGFDTEIMICHLGFLAVFVCSVILITQRNVPWSTENFLWGFCSQTEPTCDPQGGQSWERSRCVWAAYTQRRGIRTI